MPSRRLARFTGAFAACAAFVLSAACGLHLGSGVEARDTWSRTYTVQAGATLDLRETNGTVRLTAVDGDTVSVQATRIVRASTEEKAKKLLAEFAIAESATPERIEIDSSDRSLTFSLGVSRSVDYTITVPRSMNVTVKSTNGSVQVSGIAGALRLEAVNGELTATDLGGSADVTCTNGAIDLQFAQVSGAGARVKTTNGEIVVRLPASANASIAARVTNGDITAENLKLTTSEETRRRLTATIGTGGPEIRLESVNGEIRVIGR